MPLTTPFTPRLLALEGEVTYVQEEMRRIEAASQPRSLHQYVDLCRRFNAIQSATRALPNRVLSLIFQHASPLVDPSSDREEDWLLHLPLRLVSSHWYYIVQSTPQLWNHVRSGKHNADARFGQYLKLCLNNSGSLPLTIFLTFGIEASNSRFLVSLTVDDALRCNLHRIKCLKVFAAPITWLSIIPEMFQLTSLCLFLSKRIMPKVAKSTIMDLAMLSRINTFSLSSRCMHDIKLGPAALSITRLEFTETPIDICIGLYLMCHNLTDFQCHDAQIPSRSAVVPEVPTSLLKRQSLTLLDFELLGGNLSHWNDYIFKWTPISALETLSWTGSSCPTSNYDAAAFFRRLPKSLTHLHFSHITPLIPDTESLIQHIRHDCNISLIELASCNEVFLHNILQNLFKYTTREGEEIIPFPNLIHLSVDICDDERSPGLASVAGMEIAQLLEERKNIIKDFTLESTNELGEWKGEIWDRLEKLVRGGLSLGFYGPSEVWPDSDDIVMD